MPQNKKNNPKGLNQYTGGGGNTENKKGATTKSLFNRTIDFMDSALGSTTKTNGKVTKRTTPVSDFVKGKTTTNVNKGTKPSNTTTVVTSGLQGFRR